jgi:predicted HD phosphohydrolase
MFFHLLQPEVSHVVAAILHDIGDMITLLTVAGLIESVRYVHRLLGSASCAAKLLINHVAIVR